MYIFTESGIFGLVILTVPVDTGSQEQQGTRQRND